MNVAHLSNKTALDFDIRVSIGSLALLNMRDIKILAKPTTIYLMVEEHCMFNCLYCAQARESKANFENLSRITWPKEKFGKVLESLITHRDKYKRICFQVVNGRNYFENLVSFLKAMKEVNLNVPISISIRESNEERIKQLFELGVERIGLPIDVVSKENFSKIRGGNYEETFNKIIAFGREFKGRITTHIIVGLLETDEELINAMKGFFDNGVLVSLFAFTPIKGTPLEHFKTVPLERYRKMQFVRSLIFKNIPFSPIYEKDTLKAIEMDYKKEFIESLLNDLTIYMTKGCPNCNRPFYNEKPNGPMYNFPTMPTIGNNVVSSYVSQVVDGKVIFK